MSHGEEDEIHEEALISSDKEESPKSGLSLHFNKLPKKLSPKVDLEV